MKRRLLPVFVLALLLWAGAVSASAVTNDVVKVGLYYGSSAVSSVNAEYDDTTADAFAYGYYTAQRSFVSLGTIYGEDFLTVSTSADAVYEGSLRSDGYVICTAGGEFEGSGGLAKFSNTALGVLNRAGELLLVFDYEGLHPLALQAEGIGRLAPETWCKGNKYYGGFSYERAVGGAISVYGMVELEDYVKGVLPYEMSNSWPLEALKAQAVCARTFALSERHSGFDVCATTHCQTYKGVRSDGHGNSDEAVMETAGECMYYDGDYAIGYYCSCNGGATESSENVWGSKCAYLIGKLDPYEMSVASSIKGYSYTLSYTAESLTSRLQEKGYHIGTVQDMVVSGFTPTGNVLSVTVTDITGKSITLSREKCRTVLGANSQRFTINGAEAAAGIGVNGTGVLADMNGVSVISGSGTVSRIADGSALYMMTAGGKQPLSAASSGGSDGVKNADFVISGSGNGHNVGMSQWGAYAMAKQNYTYEDILNFYFTDIQIR